jgi:hypothetical protein
MPPLHKIELYLSLQRTHRRTRTRCELGKIGVVVRAMAASHACPSFECRVLFTLGASIGIDSALKTYVAARAIALTIVSIGLKYTRFVFKKYV